MPSAASTISRCGHVVDARSACATEPQRTHDPKLTGADRCDQALRQRPITTETVPLASGAQGARLH